MADLLGNGLSNSWVRQCVMALSQMLDLAVKDGRLLRNPIADLRKPRPVAGEDQVFLTHEELARLAQECGSYGSERDEVLALFRGYTGLRWGEVRALKIKRVDLLRQRIEIAANLPDGTPPDQPVAPKNHQRRVVPFPAFLTGGLQGVVGARGRDDFLFATERGTPLDLSNWRHNGLDRAVRAAGVAPFTTHNFRDTAASLALSAGANVKALQRMLGHQSAAMTLDRYAGLFSNDLDTLAQCLDAAARAAKQAPTARKVTANGDSQLRRGSTPSEDRG
jgi:integrase